MRLSMKLDVRVNLLNEVSVSIDSAYSALPKHLLEDLADTIRKFMSDNREELTNDESNTLPTLQHIAIPPRG